MDAKNLFAFSFSLGFSMLSFVRFSLSFFFAFVVCFVCLRLFRSLSHSLTLSLSPFFSLCGSLTWRHILIAQLQLVVETLENVCEFLGFSLSLSLCGASGMATKPATPTESSRQQPDEEEGRDSSAKPQNVATFRSLSLSYSASNPPRKFICLISFERESEREGACESERACDNVALSSRHLPHPAACCRCHCHWTQSAIINRWQSALITIFMSVLVVGSPTLFLPTPL